MSEMVGPSVTASTVSTNSSEALAAPSLTVMRMVEAPVWLAAGVTVTVRSAPEPPRTMLAPGTSASSEEVAARVRLPAAVSTSPTVKAIGPVEVSSLMARSTMVGDGGGSFDRG